MDDIILPILIICIDQCIILPVQCRVAAAVNADSEENFVLYVCLSDTVHFLVTKQLTM